MNWDNRSKRKFRKALQDVYRSYLALKIFVRDGLDEDLGTLVEQADLETVTFELLEWAESQGAIDRLYAAFCEENPHHSFAKNPSATAGDRYVPHRDIEGDCKAVLTNKGALVRIKAPHQMGKTELLSRLCEFAEGQDYAYATIDLRTTGSQPLASLDGFWRWLCGEVAEELGIETPLEKHWDVERGCNASCTTYIEKAVLRPAKTAVVLMLDNVDALFARKEIAQEFFKLLRSWHEQAKLKKSWRKLRQVLTYSTEPLTQLDFANANHSPFNVGKAIELPNLSAEQVTELAEQFELELTAADRDQLLDYFGGHPALMQVSFERLAMSGDRTVAGLCAEAMKRVGCYSGHLLELERFLDGGGLMAQMREIARSVEPVKVEKSVAYGLYRLGLIDWDADNVRVVPRCGLYREWFERDD